MAQKKPEQKNLITFEKGDKALFTPLQGGRQEVIIVSLTEPSTTKYGCEFPDGTVMPVNVCYLQKIDDE
jgi:hypothetical protein